MSSHARLGADHAQDQEGFSLALDEGGLELGPDGTGELTDGDHHLVEVKRFGHGFEHTGSRDVLGADLMELGVDVGDLRNPGDEPLAHHLAGEAQLFHLARHGHGLEMIHRVHPESEAAEE